MRNSVFIVAAAMLVAPVLAFAQDEGVKGKVSFTFSAGVTIPAGGEFHQGGTGTVLALPTSVDAKTYSDVYDPGFGWRAGLGVGIAPNVELFGDFAWERSEAQELSVGNVAGLDLRAAFGEYTSLGVEGGFRFHFAPGAPVNPYLSAVAGFRRIEAIPGTFSVPAAGVTLSDTPFFDDSTVPVFGGDFGILFATSSRVSLGIEAGLRYHTDLSDLEGLAGTGLENLNDAGRRWSVPVSGLIRFNF